MLTVSLTCPGVGTCVHVVTSVHAHMSRGRYYRNFPKAGCVHFSRYQDMCTYPAFGTFHLTRSRDNDSGKTELVSNFSFPCLAVMRYAFAKQIRSSVVCDCAEVDKTAIGSTAEPTALAEPNSSLEHCDFIQ